MSRSRLPSRPFGITAWASPYLAGAKVILGTSAAQPLELSEFADLARFDLQELFAREVRLAHTPAGGSLELRELIADRVDGLVPDNVTVTAGAGEAMFALAWSLVREGGHVIVEVPTHQSVFAALERTGCDVSEIVSPIELDALLDEIRPETAVVFLTSPHNPTGHVWAEDELQRIAQELERVGAILVVDEAFWGIEIGKRVPARAAGIAPNVVSVGSLSKVHGLPGLRVGWAAGPPLVVDDVRALHADTIRSLPVFSEQLAIHALRAEAALLERTQGFVDESLALLGALTDRHPGGVDLPEPDGGTVALAYLRDLDVERFCRELAVEEGVLVAPGDACFGLPGCVALNLALQSSDWERALPALDRALGRLAPAAGLPAAG